ncbi:MAG: hypothetical protein V1833_06465 [Elusimicrobiota bacterium]
MRHKSLYICHCEEVRLGRPTKQSHNGIATPPLKQWRVAMTTCPTAILADRYGKTYKWICY